MSLSDKIRRYLKAKRRRWIEPIRRAVTRARHARGDRYCPICESRLRFFLPMDNPPRNNALCPVCGSIPRHRMDWMFFRVHTDLFDGTGKRMLHVAPERFLSSRLSRVPNLDYLSADLVSNNAMVRMDITDIDYPDDSFSVIYCSHVLEHIQDDRRAMAELRRVLRPDGWALLQVPITAERIHEDPAITDPEERRKHFGRWNHVRHYGMDYADRLAEAGFRVEVQYARDLLPREECRRMGFGSNRPIFLCRKGSAGD